MWSNYAKKKHLKNQNFAKCQNIKNKQIRNDYSYIYKDTTFNNIFR